MMPLERLNIKDLESLVFPYRNLFYHRTVILEGIRKIAFRNMIHLVNTIDFLEDSQCNAIRNDLQIEHIKAKMLSDQGVTDNRFNRSIIEWATFFPIQLYLALLYAEIEFYQCNIAQNSLYFDETFSNYIEDNKECMNTLRHFRNSFLHPSTDQDYSELAFLQTSPSYNMAPELQKELDEYIVRLRMRLLNTLEETLYQLPELQQLFCQNMFLNINMIRMSNYQDLQGFEYREGQAKLLSTKIKQISDIARSWQPTSKQKDIGYRLAECLNIVNPSGPEQNLTPPETSQPPIHDKVLSVLSSFVLTPSISATDRHTAHIQHNLRSYYRIVITGLVLLNEDINLGTELLQNEQIKQEPQAIDSVLLNYYLQLPFQLQQEYAARIRVIVALSYEVLRVYRKVLTENNLLPNPRLNEFMSEQSFEHLKLHRNSIFHVLDKKYDPYTVDWNFIGRDNIDITGFWIELSNFIMSHSGLSEHLSTS